MQQGACTSADPEMFHGRNAATMNCAKKVCQACPVVAVCLDYALARMSSEADDGTPETAPIGQFGVWGNTLPSERWVMLGRRPSRQTGARCA